MNTQTSESLFYKKKSRRKVAIIAILAALTLLGMGTIASEKTSEVLAASTLMRASSVSSARSDSGTVPNTAGPLVKKISVELTVDGKAKTLDFIEGATVEDLIKKAEVKVAKDDILSVGLTETLKDGSKVKVTRVTKKQDEVLKETEYETVYQDDETLPEGETSLIQAGANRVEKEVYDVIYHDGKEAKRELKQTEVVEEGQDEIIAKGTMVAPEEPEEVKEEETESPASEDSGNNDSTSDNTSVSSESTSNETSSETSSSGTTSTGVLTKAKGVNYGPTGKETYYNLNMDAIVKRMGQYGYSEDDYWIREDGVKMLGDYVMVAANLERYPRGTTVATSLGTGLVCDTGGFAYSNPTQLDIATNW